MTSNEFVTWLKGFAAAKREGEISTEDWELIMEELNEISAPSNIPYIPGYPAGVVNHTEIPVFNSYTTTEERIL